MNDIEREETDDGSKRGSMTIIKMPVRGAEIQTSLGGDYTGRCHQCGSSNLWDDATAYGCNACGMLRCFG